VGDRGALFVNLCDDPRTLPAASVL
jgi:hypothetical protein